MTNQAATDFPVPADLEGFWIWDKLHCPRPLAPLEQELLLETCLQGFNRSMAETESIIEPTPRFVNYYPYLSMPLKDLGGVDQEEALERTKQKAAELMPRIGELWETEWLPGMLPALERARNTDYTSLDDDALVARLEEMGADVVDRWAIHGKLNYAFYAAGIFGDFYNEVLQPEDPTEPYEALQGFPSIALESSRELWRLSRIVRSDPELRELFETLDPDELLPRLDQFESGRSFRRELDEFLKEYGWRSDSVYELSKPAWWEDPRIPLNSLQGYLVIDDENGPDAGYERAVQRREQLLADARRKLASEPEKLQRFEELYEQASCFTPVVEDHNHYIDQMGDITLRYPALEIGRRLAERGLLRQRDDVLMLRVAEIKEAMAGKDHSELAAKRREEFDHYSQVVPPPVLGVPGPPSGDPVEDLLMRFFGTPVEPSSDPAIITGIAASPGTIRGTAKVVRTLEQASKLNQGDIMVCEMTLPPWTPLFSTVSAVVADTGGLLSHCAIVAREYRLPCVVGTAVGTAMIKDGMEITVDGTKGLVRIESSG